MATNDDLEQELVKVTAQLGDLEEQIERLLQKQNRLRHRKSELEQTLNDRQQRENNRQADDKYSKTDFPWSQKMDKIRSEVFRIGAYRPLQLRTMNATLSGEDCFLVMPTGGGKSLCFQLPALVSDGITLVVSPLVSLMEDQTLALHKLDVPACMLNASSPKEHVKYVMDGMVTRPPVFRLLYVTPEKLAKSKRFMAKLEKMKEARLFSRLVIDEVHCCSQWGHDFRPDYKFLGVMRRQFPEVPILGLTATATKDVLQDVRKMLGLSQGLEFRSSFNRRNLFYEVRPKPSGMEASMDDVQKLISSRFQGQSGIVYCLTQKDTEQVAKELQRRGIKARCYHGNLTADYRSNVHTCWINNDIQIVVATIAFGMGIDKPDVRFVIHHSMSKSIENYYQESGRAGRDDERAYCILYAGITDVSRQSTMVFTEQTGQSKLYNMVEYAFDVSRCRRSLIAGHFGERWDKAQCEGMCDNCNPGPGKAGCSKEDVTSLCRDIITILEHAQATEQRVTTLKLLDSLRGRGVPALRVHSVTPPSLSPRNQERVITNMLLLGYLKEDFHFTAYTTISYLLPGPSAHRLMSDEHKVVLTLEAESKKSTSRSSGTSATSTKTSATSSKLSKVKSSATSTKPKVTSSSSQASAETTTKSKSQPKRKKTSQTKKRSVIVDSDEDFDFGEESRPPKKHRKSNCITISEDEDMVSIETDVMGDLDTPSDSENHELPK